MKIPCMIFSRVTGYYSDSNTWHKGKKEEFANRVNYKLPVFKSEVVDDIS